MKKIIGIIMIVSLSLSAQDKRAITFEDFFSMKRLGNLAACPDGKWIAYDLKTANIDENSFKTDLWLFNTETRENFQLTAAEKSSSGPVWSPDGKALYFNRDNQIWKIIIADKSELKVSDVPTGASGVVLNATGKQMLFSSEVYPDCPDMECNKQKLDEAESGKVKARIIDKLLYRHWNRWLEGKRSHVFLAETDGKIIRDVTPGDYDTPPLDLGSSHDYTFSPDGKEICFVRNIEDMPAASTNNDLFTTVIDDPAIKKITENKGNDNHPLYSPDGKYIAYRSMGRAGFEADRYRIMLYDRERKTVKELTKGFDFSAANIIWHPEGKDIYFSAQVQDNFNIYRVNIANPIPEAVLKGHYISDMQFLTPEILVFAKQTASMPKEIFSYNLWDEKLTQLTNFNGELLSRLELPAYEEFWFEGANNDKVHGLLFKPPLFDPAKKYPAIELIHGGPQGVWGNDFHYRWNYQMFAAQGYVVFMINFHGSTGYGQKFTDAVSKDWGGAPFEDIIKGTEYVINHFDFIDKERIGAAGASYGGFMINWIAGAGNEHPFKCLVSHDGVYEQVSMYGATEELWFPEWEFNGAPWQEGSLYQKWNPANRAGNFKTPTLVIHGENDFRVPYTQGLQMFTALQRQGVPSRLLFFPDEDHFVQKPQNARLWWKTVHAWFEKYLK
ncbi:MAG: S9 family peptidase [Calditrichaceae bacterium]|nr:S9 family peptidase [Calditrichaceae bacterium]MBN2710793.1 S9 family peptidase [Calditrichaceae bacterium]RQV94713.1 MAG: S9 family peptidase [Calditrichota bacterium]